MTGNIVRLSFPVTRPQPDWAAVAAELAKPAVTLLLVWQEYRDRHPEGYSYSQFRRYYRSHQKLTPEPRMRREALPAQLCEVDYAGMTMPVITAHGERQASLFVGTLPFSTYLYAEATWTQASEDLGRIGKAGRIRFAAQSRPKDSRVLPW